MANDTFRNKKKISIYLIKIRLSAFILRENNETDKYKIQNIISMARHSHLKIGHF